MLQPVVRRTWAPRGRTPVQRGWDQHDRLSVITGITLPPQRQHLGLCFPIHDRNITFEQVVEFLILLRRQLRRKFILVLERYSAHRKAVRLLQQAHTDWFEVEWLPAYAPELNLVEMVRNHSKYGVLANFIPGDVHDLRQAVTASLEATAQQPSLMRSFFRYAALQF
jgi:transposase